MTAKVVLVTGASSGVGRETAIRSAEAGHTVVATMRDPKRLGGAGSAPGAHDDRLAEFADVRRLDVTDAESIAECLRGVIETHGRLDVLVNNAGWAHTLPTIEMCPLERYRSGFEVNFFGVVAMTKAAMPHLRAGRGRLITIGSTRGLLASPFNEGYSAAKFAVEGFMESLAPTAAELGVDVVMIEPGPVLGTAFAANSGSSRDRLLAESGPYHEALISYLDYFADSGHPGAQSASEVAEVVTHAVSQPDPPFRIPTGDWAKRYLETKIADVSGGRVRAMTASWFETGRKLRRS